MSVQFIPLEQACDFLSGYAWSAANFQCDPVGMPIIRIQNVDAVRESDFVYWDGPFDERFVVRNGDLLLTLSGSFRVVVWDGPEALLNQRIVKLMPKDGYTRDWLLYVLRNALNAISGMGRHALVSNVALADLRALKIPRQTIEEQRRIAAILDQAETLRTQRRTALALLDSLTQSLFLDMFGDAETNKMGFQIATLGNAIKLKSGNFLPASQMAEKGQFPVYGGNGINGKHDEFMFEEPKIVIGRVGAYCGCVHVTEPRSWVTDNALYIEAFDSALHPEYLAFALSEAKLNQYASQSGQPLISGARIAAVKLLGPPLPLQQTFATRIASIEALKATHRRALAALDALFASLQQRAFAGQL